VIRIVHIVNGGYSVNSVCITHLITSITAVAVAAAITVLKGL